MRKIIVLLLILVLIGCSGPVDSEDVNRGQTTYSETTKEYEVEYLFTHDVHNDIYRFKDGDVICYLAYGLHEVSIACVK